MSNLEDEKLIAHARIYHATVRKLREENAEKEKLKAEWEANNGPKPTLDMVMGGPLKSEEEISKIATQTAIQKQQEQDDLERIGAVEPTSEKPPRGSLEAFFGDDKEAIRKAREDQEQRQHERRQRERDSNGRDMEP